MYRRIHLRKAYAEGDDIPYKKADEKEHEFSQPIDAKHFLLANVQNYKLLLFAQKSFFDFKCDDAKPFSPIRTPDELGDHAVIEAFQRIEGNIFPGGQLIGDRLTEQQCGDEKSSLPQQGPDRVDLQQISDDFTVLDRLGADFFAGIQQFSKVHHPSSWLVLKVSPEYVIAANQAKEKAGVKGPVSRISNVPI